MCTSTYIITTCCISSIIFYACQSSYDSVSSSLKLPATSLASATGYDDENDIIVIFGGYDWPRQFIQFKNNEFIFHDSSYLPSAQDISGDGQNYFQLNDTLWMLNQQGTHFITTSTHPPYDVTIPGITIPILVDNNGCLAMTHHHMFIVGGETTKSCDPHDSVQIYDMINGEWLSGVPSLPTNRMSMTCYAVDDTLYAIGGYGGDCNQYYDSILTLNISDAALADISSQQWQVAPSTLHTPSRGSCIVKHRNDLIVIGGKDRDLNRLKEVNVINTLTGECNLAGTLSVATSDSTCIIHRSTNTLYIFGGKDATDSWQFINLPTVDPTADPTTDPTNSPTQFPTSNPTESPTQNPTQNPSFTPSSQPSSDPSLQPTRIPTVSEATTKEDATLSPLRDTTEYTTDNSKSGKGEAEFVMDELVTVLVVVCGTLCLISVIVVVIICGILKKDANHNISGMDNAVNRNKENRSSGDSDNCEEANEDKVTTTGADVTVGAMINDKIVRGIASTKQGLDKVVQNDGEKDDIELANVVEESASNESLYDNHATTGAIHPQAMQNESDVEEGHRGTEYN